MGVVGWLRRFVLVDHEVEHERVNRELDALRAELTDLERVVRLRRLDAVVGLRARRHGEGS